MIDLTSPNETEVKFLNDPTKRDEYMEHITTKLNLPSDAVIVDVGANIGAFSCRIAQYLQEKGGVPQGNAATICAIEPFAELFEHLVKNTSNYSAVKCRKLAIGTVSGDINGTYLPNYTLLSGFHVSAADKALLEELAGRSLENEFTAVQETVKCMPLSDFLEQECIRGRVDLLKIDVEKAELDVLKSLGTRLADVGSVVAEVHQENLEEFQELLESRYGKVRCWVSEKDLPKFTLGEAPKQWAEELNTFIVFAH